MPDTARFCQQCGFTQYPVTTRMVIEGPADRVTEFKRRHIVHHPPKAMTRCDGTTFVREAFRHFDFNSIIPTPDCLEGLEASGRTLDAVEALSGRSVAQLLTERNPGDIRVWLAVLALQGGGFDAERDSARVAELQTRLDDMPVEQLEMGMRALTAINECGYPTRYEWALVKWATKWNAYDFVLVDDTHGLLEFRFETAGSLAPEPVFEELARMHPYLLFTTYSFDDSGAVHGQARDGVYTSDYEVEGTKPLQSDDRAPARRFFVRHHENGWAAVVDMGGTDVSRRVIAGIARVRTESLNATALVAYDFYGDRGSAAQASDQLLRKWTNHARCSAACCEWIEIEVLQKPATLQA